MASMRDFIKSVATVLPEIPKPEKKPEPKPKPVPKSVPKVDVQAEQQAAEAAWTAISERVSAVSLAASGDRDEVAAAVLDSRGPGQHASGQARDTRQSQD